MQAFQYDNLDRLTNSNVTGGTYGLYSEGYTYDGTTGNLSSKNSVNYTYNTTHKHAVASLSNGNSYSYDANGNMTQRVVGGQTYNLSYDAENRLVSVSGAATASFVYDADGKQVKATVNGVTTYYVNQNYEVKNGVVTKYYFAGTTRLAVRTGGTLSFLLADHIGSSSLTTDANGLTIGESLYKAFGESRYLSGTLNTDYKFTGQREEASLGIYFFQSRWFDPTLGRFLSPDSIVPRNAQGMDRYAYVSNNPLSHVDPTGHCEGDPDDRHNPDYLCWNRSDQIENTYSFIDVDYKNWTAQEVFILIKSLAALANFFGSVDKFGAAVGNVTLYRSHDTTTHLAGSDAGKITFWDGAFNNGKNQADSNAWAIYSITHEFGHQYDIRHGKSGSRKFADEHWFCPIYNDGGPAVDSECFGWAQGDKTRDYAGVSPSEDFAETFAVLVWLDNDFGALPSGVNYPSFGRLVTACVMVCDMNF